MTARQRPSARSGCHLDPPRDLAVFYADRIEKMVRALTLYCGSKDVAEELAQEAFARVCRDWSKVQRADDPEAWTYRIAFNLANSRFRRLAAERRARDRLSSLPQPQEGASETEGAAANRAALRSLLQRIPRRQRESLILRFYFDLSVSSVAAVMGCPESTVKTLTRRGVTRLRELSGEGPQP